jgi:hypothetical protein
MPHPHIRTALIAFASRGNLPAVTSRLVSTSVCAVAVLLAPLVSSVCLQAQGLTQALAPQSPVTAETLKASLAREAIRSARQASPPPIQRRVRIKTGSDVELPGVFRIQGETMSGPIVSGDPDSVTVRDPAGRMVTLPRAGHTIVGGVVGVDGQTVMVARDGGSVVTVPRSAIALLELSSGHRSRMRGAGLGLLIGGGSGAGVGFVYGRTRKCAGFFAAPGAAGDQPCFMEPEASSVAGLMLGGGAGALIGALAKPGERWVVVRPDWLTGG